MKIIRNLEIDLQYTNGQAEQKINAGSHQGAYISSEEEKRKRRKLTCRTLNKTITMTAIQHQQDGKRTEG